MNILYFIPPTSPSSTTSRCNVSCCWLFYFW